eukprot:gene7965-9798_t
MSQFSKVINNDEEDEYSGDVIENNAIITTTSDQDDDNDNQIDQLQHIRDDDDDEDEKINQEEEEENSYHLDNVNSESTVSPVLSSTSSSSASSRKALIQKKFDNTISKIKSIKKEDLKLDTSKYIKSIIYGGMDGLVSIFVSIAVVASGNAKVTVLLIVAISKLIAGAISMGMGDYLGTQADVDFAKGERQREAWEVEYYIEGEKKEMVDLYMQKGIPENVATEVVEILAKNPKGFVDIMMVEELGIMPDAESEVAWKNGLVNFVSFLIFGIIPLLPYLALLIVAAVWGNQQFEILGTFITVAGVSVITLFLMGIFKAKSTDTVWWKSGFSTVFFGCIGAAIGYVTVVIIKKIFPNVDI